MNQLLERRRGMMSSGEERPDYLKFTAQEDNCTVTLSKVNNPTNRPTEYSLNMGVFQSYTYGTAITLNTGDTLEWRRAIGYSGTAFSDSENKYYVFSTSGAVVVTGLVTTLLSASGNVTTTSRGCFAYLFTTTTGLTVSLTLPSTLTSLGTYAFYKASGFSGNLVIPNTMTSISDSVFSGCSGLNGTLTLPNNLTNINRAAFNGTKFTGTLVLPDTLTTIGNNAFSNNNFSGTLTLPSRVTSIGQGAFNSCTNLSNMVSLATSPPTAGLNFFPAKKPIYVPYSEDHTILAAYKSASGWSSHASYIYELNPDGTIPT